MSTYQRKRPGLLHEIIFLVALAFMATWELLWTVDSPSPLADDAEDRLWLIPVLLVLVAALMFFLYFAASFGCRIGAIFGGECTFASATLANWLFFPK